MKNFGIKALILTALMVSPGMIETIMAVPPPPGPPAIGAPLDASVVLLVILATVYGVIKVYGKNKVA